MVAQFWILGCCSIFWSRKKEDFDKLSISPSTALYFFYNFFFNFFFIFLFFFFFFLISEIFSISLTTSFIGFFWGLIIFLDIFFSFITLSKTGFFLGRTVYSKATEQLKVSKNTTIVFIKKDIFLDINFTKWISKLCYKYLCLKDQMLL